MLTPLYAIANVPATITVVAPGAAQGDATVPVDSLTIALPNGTIVDFGSAKFAKLVLAAAIGDDALATDLLPTALVAGDVATIAGSSASPLLSEKWAKLKTDADRTALHLAAEMMLGLVAPVYTGDDADMLGFAIVRQINFMLEHGVTPSVVQSAADGNRGTTTTYRNRWVDPDAAAIVALVTGAKPVRFEPATVGV